MLMQVAVSEIKSMDSDKVEILVFTNGGNVSKNKIAQTAVHFIDKGCAR
jgi:hypothetical protein